MRVEITEKKLRDSGYDLTEGDIIAVPSDVGSSWCANGWAKDVEGKVATGERKPGVQQLKVEKAKHVTKSTTKGG